MEFLIGQGLPGGFLRDGISPQSGTFLNRRDQSAGGFPFLLVYRRLSPPSKKRTWPRRLELAGRDGRSFGEQGSEKMRYDHLGLRSVEGVALAERGSQQLLLCGGAPYERWNNSGKQNQEGRPASKCERLSQREHGKAEIDRVADMAIGTGRDEARDLVCDGDKAPCGA
jgi:hypothetical protein